jgi:hypothetical protein
VSGVSLDDLGASLNRCTEALEGAQSSINVTRDRADGASRILATTADGSSNELLAQVMGMVAVADDRLEEILGAYAQAAVLVREYKISRGLGG